MTWTSMTCVAEPTLPPITGICVNRLKAGPGSWQQPKDVISSSERDEYLRKILHSVQFYLSGLISKLTTWYGLFKKAHDKNNI